MPSSGLSREVNVTVPQIPAHLVMTATAVSREFLFFVHRKTRIDYHCFPAMLKLPLLKPVLGSRRTSRTWSGMLTLHFNSVVNILCLTAHLYQHPCYYNENHAMIVNNELSLRTLLSHLGEINCRCVHGAASVPTGQLRFQFKKI
jgi:hypothetical protein